LTKEEYIIIAILFDGFLNTEDITAKTIAANFFVDAVSRIGGIKKPDGTFNPKYVQYYWKEVDRYTPKIAQENPGMSPEEVKQEVIRRLNSYINQIINLATSPTRDQNTPQNQPTPPNNQPKPQPQRSNERGPIKINPNGPGLRESERKSGPGRERDRKWGNGIESGYSEVEELRMQIQQLEQQLGSMRRKLQQQLDMNSDTQVYPGGPLPRKKSINSNNGLGVSKNF
jgi:hypothetical protein